MNTGNKLRVIQTYGTTSLRNGMYHPELIVILLHGPGDESPNYSMTSIGVTAREAIGILYDDLWNRIYKIAMMNHDD